MFPFEPLTYWLLFPKKNLGVNKLTLLPLITASFVLIINDDPDVDEYDIKLSLSILNKNWPSFAI